MKYLVYIFDFDYTLGDSTNGIVLSVNHALTEMGFPPSEPEAIRRTVGLNLPETFERLTGHHNEEKGREFAMLFRRMADRVMTDNTVLYPKTANVLATLKSAGAKAGIVTTKFHYRIDQILAKYGIPHLIDGIVGAEDVKNTKPDPEGLLHLIEDLHISVRDAVMIGDSVVDAETAQRASADFIAVTTGATPREAFSSYPCRKIITELSQLLG